MKSITYKSAGVDIEEGDRLVKKIKPLAKSTFRRGVISDIGSFGGLFSLDTENLKEPVLVSSTDGVGTKLKIAIMMDKHDTVGIDLVAMNVNDIITHGAEPLYFLDYIATSNLRSDIIMQIISGIVQGCKEAGCALIGGETAEMPSFYRRGEYDLAGFAVGVVEKSKIIDGSGVGVGDSIIGLSSSGLHSNGFSLARKIFFELLKMKPTTPVDEFGSTLGEEILKPTRIYAKAILNIIKDHHIKGIAHITGGGLIGNIPRILPSRCTAMLRKNSWDIPAVFSIIKEKGKVSDSEMFRTFNNGIGMVIVVSRSETDSILQRLKGLGEKPYLIGEVVQRADKEKQIVFV